METDSSQQALTTQSSSDDKATSLLTLERLILNIVADIDEQSQELRTQKEMLTSIFESDPDYREVTEKAKSVQKEKNQIRQRLQQQPQASDLARKVKEISQEIKEKRDSLSNHLQQYALLSGTTQFEDDEGQVREIVYIAKLVKRSAKFLP